jgi:hypothetical protein
VLGADQNGLLSMTDLGTALFMSNIVLCIFVMYFTLRGNVPRRIPVETYGRVMAGKIVFAILFAMLSTAPTTGPAAPFAGLVHTLALLGPGYFIYSMITDVFLAAILRKLEFYGAYKVIIFNLFYIPFVTFAALLLAVREQNKTLKLAREDIAYKKGGVVIGKAIECVRVVSQPVQPYSQARTSPHYDVRPLPGSVETLYSPELVEGRDFNPHMVVAGASGSGKTTFLYHLVKELSENYPTIFTDIKGDITRALLRERVNAHIVPVAAVGINPFHSIVEGEKERHMVERLIDSISVVEEVGSKQGHFIREAYAEMEHSKTPLTYSGLLARVVAKEEKTLSADGSPYSRFGGGTRDALVGISYKLKDLAEYLRDDGASMKDIMGRVLAGRESNYPILVFNLEDISEKVRAVVLELILRSIARYMYHRGPLAYLRDKAIILAVDEAYLVTRPMRQEGRSKSVLEEIARAGRSYGLALILATQRLSDVADGIRQNCQTWIVFNTASPEDKRILKEIDVEVMASVVSELNPGEAYIRVPNPRRREYYRTTTDTIAAVIGYIFRMERELLQAEREDAEKLLQKLEKKKKDKRGRRLQVEEAGLEEAGGGTGGGGGERDSSLLNYGVVCYRCMLLTSDPGYCHVCGQPPLVKGSVEKGQKEEGVKQASGTISSKPSTDHVEFTEADLNEEWFLDMGESQQGEFSGEEIRKLEIEMFPDKREELLRLSDIDILDFVSRRWGDGEKFVRQKLLKRAEGGELKPKGAGKALLDAYDRLRGLRNNG